MSLVPLARGSKAQKIFILAEASRQSACPDYGQELVWYCSLSISANRRETSKATHKRIFRATGKQRRLFLPKD